jgi:hypothetical protein
MLAAKRLEHGGEAPPGVMTVLETDRWREHRRVGKGADCTGAAPARLLAHRTAWLSCMGLFMIRYPRTSASVHRGEIDGPMT